MNVLEALHVEWQGAMTLSVPDDAGTLTEPSVSMPAPVVDPEAEARVLAQFSGVLG